MYLIVNTITVHKTMQFSLLPPCRHVVLDEADQMLERGFAEPVEEILAASFSESKNTKVNVHVHTWSVDDQA